MNNNRIYEPVDIEGLATALAEDAWEEEVKSRGITRDELYETIVETRPDSVNPSEIRRIVKPHWAYNFFALREGYLSLINEHKPVEV